MIAFIKRHWFLFLLGVGAAVWFVFPRVRVQVRTVVGTVTEGDGLTITYHGSTADELSDEATEP